MTNYVWVGIAVGVFFAGIGIGYAVFINTYNPYYMMMQNPAMFNQMMGKNPQFGGQYMGYIMQDPKLRLQMYDYMFQNKDFMYGMMGNQQFQNNYMGPWMMQNPNFQQQWTKPNATNQFNNTGYGMMGGNAGMGPDMMGNAVTGKGIYKTIPIKDAISEMNSLPNYAQVVRDNDTIVLSSSTIDLGAFAMMGQDAINVTGYNPPSSAHAQGDAFAIGGLINPTLVVRSGSQLNITLVNLDEDMTHNFVITSSAPPYAYMSMNSMMSGNGGFLSMMPILPNEEKQQGYAYEFSNSVTLSQSGTYWYICTYPGHAEEGMYGQIIVQ